jgi:hypothetical protein
VRPTAQQLRLALQIRQTYDVFPPPDVGGWFPASQLFEPDNDHHEVVECIVVAVETGWLEALLVDGSVCYLREATS